LQNQPIEARRPSITDRLLLWSRRPQRVREAGSLMMFMGLAQVAWFLLSLTLFGLGTLHPHGPLRFVEFCALMLGAFHVRMTWVGWQTMNCKKWAFWANSVYALSFYEAAWVRGIAGGLPSWVSECQGRGIWTMADNVRQGGMWPNPRCCAGVGGGKKNPPPTLCDRERLGVTGPWAGKDTTWHTPHRS
jgi:hypothetical protein